MAAARFLRSHAIGKDAASVLASEDYASFLACRCNTLIGIEARFVEALGLEYERE